MLSSMRIGRVIEDELEVVSHHPPPARPVADRWSPSGQTGPAEVVVPSVQDRLRSSRQSGSSSALECDGLTDEWHLHVVVHLALLSTPLEEMIIVTFPMA